LGNPPPVKTDEHDSFGRYLWPKCRKSLLLCFIVILLAGLIAVYWSRDIGVFQRKGLLTFAAGVLVLEDCGRDFRTPPFEDAVIMFDPKTSFGGVQSPLISTAMGRFGWLNASTPT
jgi:hypothetical protein